MLIIKERKTPHQVTAKEWNINIIWIWYWILRTTSVLVIGYNCFYNGTVRVTIRCPAAARQGCIDHRYLLIRRHSLMAGGRYLSVYMCRRNKTSHRWVEITTKAFDTVVMWEMLKVCFKHFELQHSKPVWWSVERLKTLFIIIFFCLDTKQIKTEITNNRMK